MRNVNDATKKELKVVHSELYVTLALLLDATKKELKALRKSTMHAAFLFPLDATKKELKDKTKSTCNILHLEKIGCNPGKIERRSIKIIFVSRKKGKAGERSEND